MAIDILSLQPSVISRDLRGKYVLLYGKPKSGKTTAAPSFPNSLLCAFEKGYNAIGGVRAADITRWADFKLILRQLEKPEAKAMYETVIIDKITQLGYGVVLIAHNTSRIEKTADGQEIEIISPDLPKRAAEVCNGIVDIIGYIGNEYVNGEYQRWLYTRETPTLFAGSRFKYLAPKIEFGYEQLVNAISDAIDEAEKNGATVVDKMEQVVEEELDYDSLMAEARELWTKLVHPEDNGDEEMARTILKKLEMTFGRQIKLSEITEDQVSLLELAVIDMRDLVNN